MSYLFCDTSALVKRYSPEIGSNWLLNLIDPKSGNATLIAEITLAETAAAFAAKHRATGGITLTQRDSALKLFLQHCVNEFQVITINKQVIDNAVMLTQNYKLRGYDAVQLAAALEANYVLNAAGLNALTFISSDADLLKAAVDEGLATDNPNLHP